MLIVKVLILVVLGIITYQDLKTRWVYAFLFPVLTIMLGVLHYFQVQPIHFAYAMGMNIGFVLLLLSVLYVYSQIKIKKPFFKEVFGLGDALYFIALAAAFPTITFIVLFVFSILFSALSWLFLNKNFKHETIPLAGYMSLFLMLVLIGTWSSNLINLYLI